MPTDEEPLKSAPLPSSEDAAADDDEEETETAPTTDTAPASAPAPRTRPPPQPFKISTFLYVFLGFLGIWMLIDQSARNSIAGALGISASAIGPLYLLIGFQSHYLLATMALAGAFEMVITALAYNYTTDWIKAAKVQKWSQAFRKVQMEAIRSGKKDRIAALKPHQERLTRLSSEVTIAQFKGMAITYFLLILIYTWVGLVIANAPSTAQVITVNGASIGLLNPVLSGLPIPWWFLIFSLYTVPFSLVFRRVLKHLWLRRYAAEHHLPPVVPAVEAVGEPA
jgi:uncharacterized membrane protein (DUF106 family)